MKANGLDIGVPVAREKRQSWTRLNQCCLFELPEKLKAGRAIGQMDLQQSPFFICEFARVKAPTHFGQFRMKLIRHWNSSEDVGSPFFA